MKTISFWSPKPGTGVSTIASAIAFQGVQSGKFTGIIELSRQYSSLPWIMGMPIPEDKSLYNAMLSQEESEIMRNFVRYKDKDLYLMALNRLNDAADLHDLNVDQVDTLLETCKEKFDWLVLDLPSSYLEATSFQAIKYHSDIVVVVLDNNVTTLAAWKVYEQLFQDTSISLSKFIFVMNKDIGLIDTIEVKEKTGIEICCKIPELSQIIKFGNEGTSLDFIPSSFKERAFHNGISKLNTTIGMPPKIKPDETRIKAKSNVFAKIFKGRRKDSSGE